MSEIGYKGPIVLFDGVCNLCNGSVRFIIKRDPDGVFKYAPLQSEAAKEILREFGLPSGKLESLILIEDGKSYVRSVAALRIARRLGGAWPLLGTLTVVPRPVRDWVYCVVAKNRYKWFGRRDECMVPGPGDADRFLD